MSERLAHPPLNQHSEMPSLHAPAKQQRVVRRATLCVLLISLKSPLFAQCTPGDPLRVHAIIDHSTSVTTREGYKRSVSQWLQSLGGSLRPGDSIFVYPLANDLYSPLQMIGVLGVRSALENPHVLTEEVDSITASLHRDSIRSTDLAVTLQRIRTTHATTSNLGCQIYFLLSDGSLAPIRKNQSRQDAWNNLLTELNNWKRPRRLLVVSLGASGALAFDPVYHWADSTFRDSTPAMRILSTISAPVIADSDSTSLARGIFFRPESPFVSPSSDELPSEATHAPDSTLYVFYELSTNSFQTHLRADAEQFLRCNPDSVDDDHTVVRFAGGCIHHIRNLRRTLPPELSTVTEFRWLGPPMFRADGTPDPLTSIAQIAVTRTDLSEPPCTSMVARQAITVNGWNRNRIGDSLRILISDAFDTIAPDTFVAHRIPSTSCYAVSSLQNGDERRSINAGTILIRFSLIGSTAARNYPETRVQTRNEPRLVQMSRTQISGGWFWPPTMNLWVVRGNVHLSSEVKPVLVLGNVTYEFIEVKCKERDDRSCYKIEFVTRTPPTSRALLRLGRGETSDGDAIPIALKSKNFWGLYFWPTTFLFFLNILFLWLVTPIGKIRAWLTMICGEDVRLTNRKSLLYWLGILEIGVIVTALYTGLLILAQLTHPSTEAVLSGLGALGAAVTASASFPLTRYFIRR